MMLSYFVLVFAICSEISLGKPVQKDEQGKYIVPNSTQECAEDLITWCDNMEYPEGDNVGISMIAVTIVGNMGAFRALCESDNDGTTCSKNTDDWFSCNKDNKFYYEGKLLSNDSTSDLDEGICATANIAFNELSLQGLVFNNATLTQVFEKGMESFFRGMAILHEQMEALKARMNNMFGGCFPFCNQYPDYELERRPQYDIVPPKREEVERET